MNEESLETLIVAQMVEGGWVRAPRATTTRRTPSTFRS